MRHPGTPDCSIAGCKRAVYKGFLCRKHYAYVPAGQYQAAMVEAMQASYDAARRHHRKQLAYVRREIREGRAA